MSREAGFEDRCPTINIPESLNVVLKMWQNFKAKDISAFADDLKELVDRQRNDVRRAFALEVLTLFEKSMRIPLTEVSSKRPGSRTWPNKNAVVKPSRYKQVHQVLSMRITTHSHNSNTLV